MNLDEALSPEWGEPINTTLTPMEAWRVFCALAHAHQIATGVRIATSTNGATMRLHDVDAGARSPKIRHGPWDEKELVTCFRLHVTRRKSWEPESTTWGPDPYHSQYGRCQGCGERVPMKDVEGVAHMVPVRAPDGFLFQGICGPVSPNA